MAEKMPLRVNVSTTVLLTLIVHRIRNHSPSGVLPLPEILLFLDLT